MEHSPRAQELLTGLRAAFPGLRPLEEGDLPLVFALYQRNTFFNSVALEAPPKRPDFPPCAWGVMSATPRAWPFGTPWGLRRRGRSCGKGAPCIKCISPYRPSRLAGTPKERYNTRTRSASGQRLSRWLRQQRPPIVKKGRKKGVDKI